MATHHRREDQTTFCGAVEVDNLDGLECSMCKTLYAIHERATSEGHQFYTLEDVRWVLAEQKKKLKATEKE